MMNENLDELEQQLRELDSKRADLSLKLKLMKEKAEKEKPINITLEMQSQDGKKWVKLDCPYREDIVNILRGIRGRMWHGGSINTIPFDAAESFIASIKELPNVTFQWINVESYEQEKNQPDYQISINQHEFIIKVNGADSWPISRIPGSAWMDRQKHWSVPLTEGWRFPDRFKEKKVSYSEEAQRYIFSQIEMRGKLDMIANLEDVDYNPSFKDGIKMRPFQRVGSNFIEAAGFRGMIFDQPGLGKTWQALAIAHKNNFRTIIICPASLKKNWAREIKRLTGQDARVMHGTTPSDQDMLDLLTKPPQYTICNYDIIARKVDIKNTRKDTEGIMHEETKERWLWVELIKMSRPEFLIFDEAHYLQNDDSLRSRAARLLKDIPRILELTATPLMNRPSNLWPLLYILDSDTFPAHDTFVHRYTTDGRTPKNIDELHEILKTKMIRRVREDVMSQLPKVQPIPDYHELSDKASKLYGKVMEGVFEVIAEWNPDEAGNSKKVTNILAQIMRLKQICSYDKVEHTSELAVELYDGSEGSPHRKVIIFSQFVSAVHSIAKRLGQEAIVITGEDKPADRLALVDKFQNDKDIHFAVCSIKAVGEGLTMTQAGFVINHDLAWTAAAHEQAEGRAYGRLNDAHGIDSYYILCEGTIEEKILELINRKRAISEQIVDGTSESRDASVAMDLINFLKKEGWKKS